MSKSKRICPECSENTLLKEMDKYYMCSNCADAIEYHEPKQEAPKPIQGRCVGVVDETAREVYKF